MIFKQLAPEEAAYWGIRFFSLSDLHRDRFVSGLEKRLIEPAELGQAACYFEGERAVVFLTWAWLSKEAGERHAKGGPVDDYLCGNELWFVNFIAPWGHSLKAFKDLKRRFGVSAKWRRMASGRVGYHEIQAV